jgi:hypothetical protein
MNKRLLILFILVLGAVAATNAQDTTALRRDTLLFSGQLIAWTNLNPSNDLSIGLGARYLPQLNYQLPLPKTRLFDIEASANLFGNAGLRPFDSLQTFGDLKPYRLWARYSAPQFEFRLGLQKINFGAASLLRPLMWFDQVDPRDPIQFTDGVWAALGRYYFLNNANIWLWGLYGNPNPRGWELAKTNSRRPEFGGRFQHPVPKGEAGISFHHRVADTRALNGLVTPFEEAPETRIGLDVKLDLVVGCWLEASWTANRRDLGAFSHQELLNAGLDYTFGIGNGLYVIFEQLLVSYGAQAFSFSNANSFSLLSASYPISFFDTMGAIVYFDWSNGAAYSFVNWKKEFSKTTLVLMGYWNPKNNRIPTQSSTQNPYSGIGVQAILIFNH